MRCKIMHQIAGGRAEWGQVPKILEEHERIALPDLKVQCFIITGTGIEHGKGFSSKRLCNLGSSL